MIKRKKYNLGPPLFIDERSYWNFLYIYRFKLDYRKQNYNL